MRTSEFRERWQARLSELDPEARWGLFSAERDARNWRIFIRHVVDGIPMTILAVAHDITPVRIRQIIVAMDRRLVQRLGSPE